MDLLVVVEIVSVVLAFLLARVMTKPYRTLEDSRYLALPLGFVFLGFSYVFMGASFLLTTPSGIERAKWLHLFTGAYAFAFLAITYYISSKRPEREVRPFILGLITFSFLLLVFFIVVLFLPPFLAIPDYKVADEYFRLFNMLMALYVTFSTLRVHLATPEPKTVFAPFAYALLAFSQYSLLLWSVDSSYSAFLGAHILRLFSLLVFLYISYAPRFSKNSSQVGHV